MPVYHLYGLRISVDRPLLGIEPTLEPGEVDVEVRTMEGVPVESALPEPVEWTLRDSFYSYFRLEKGTGASGANYLRLHYADEPHAADFVIGPEGREVWISWSEGAPFHDINTLLQGPILGRTLRMRGVQVLHAGALAVGGQAFCLVGNKGAGKSTTTTALGRLGYPVLTDDLAALELTDGGALVQPGLTRVRLRADVMEGLGAKVDPTPIWSKDYPNQKYYLDLGSGAESVTEPLPLRAIYVLGRREPGLEPRIEPVPQGAALIELVAYSYASSILSASQRATEFATLGKLLATVPVRHVHRAEGLDALPGICSAILEDFDTLTEQAHVGER